MVTKKRKRPEAVEVDEALAAGTAGAVAGGEKRTGRTRRVGAARGET